MLYEILYSSSFLEDADAADRIFNTAEHSYATDPNRRKILIKKLSRDSYLLTPTCGKAMYTVLVCGSVSDSFMPPLQRASFV